MKTKKNHKRPNEQTNQRRNHDPIRSRKQYKAGKIKILAVSAPKRLDRLPEIPTWKEQGINVIFQHWKGIMGPKDMTEEEVAYWDDVIKRMVESDSWKGILRERGWESFIRGGEARGFG